MKKCAVLALLICGMLTVWTQANDQVSLSGGNARVVFVGDSITGQGGGWLGAGYCFQMEWALKQTYPGATPQLIALGGSGMGVGNWVGTEKSSRTTEVMLDVKNVGVKENLDQPADVLVVMLGMNDVLAPYIGATDEDLDKWIAQYRDLVTSLRARVKPKVTALGTITMFTEDPVSFKNRQIGRMNQRVSALAKELGAIVLPTGEACWEVLAMGRQLSPEYHITRDYIHPDAIGNQAVAVGMLRGLGEAAAAETLLDQRIKPALLKATEKANGLSYDVQVLEEPDSFLVRYWWAEKPGQPASNPTVKISLPEGWSAAPDQSQGTSGSFIVKGRPAKLKNIVKLEGRSGEEVRQSEVSIPAPWLVAAGLVQQWKQPPLEFDPKASVSAVDEVIAKGGDFTTPIDCGINKTLTWQKHYPSVNLTGGADPGSIDYAAITNGGTFEGGYAARWIHSDRERPVKLELSTKGLAARIHLSVWLNGNLIYEKDLTQDPQLKEARKVTVDAVLKKGENTLVIKSNHCNWQWQFAANLVGIDGDGMDDLRYSTKPQPTLP